MIIDIGQKNLILKKSQICFIAFHSSNESTSIGFASKNIKEKIQTKIEDENLMICPGHHNYWDTNSQDFFN